MSKKVSIASRSKRIRSSNLFKGTLILTIAGFVTRIIGFFYKIFLSNTMGSERLGIYQLIFPVYGIAFTIYATGIQTSISRLVAAEIGRQNYRNTYKILRIGLTISVLLALALSILIYINADFIAWRFLLEDRSAQSLRILSFVFPFCGVTSCINGYYYGLKKAGVPASTQLLEQILRVVVVYIAAYYMGNGNNEVTCEIAVIGIIIGEIASSIYNFTSLFIIKPYKNGIKNEYYQNKDSLGHKVIIKDLMSLSIPLSANRFLINILHSIEAVLIPTMLRRYGMSTADALSTLGILSGMSLPFIMFPTALINALAVLLLPTVSEAQALSNTKLIGKTTAVSIKYSMIIGIISTGIFIIFGRDLGQGIFHNEAAGSYLVVLAWLCPLIYLTTTLGSVINGLGKAHITFINSIVGTLSKILLIVMLIPQQGINGYLISLLFGQLIITIMDSIAVIRNVQFSFDAINGILKPGLIVALCGFLFKKTYDYLQGQLSFNRAIFILSFCGVYCMACVGLFIVTKSINVEDFKI